MSILRATQSESKVKYILNAFLDINLRNPNFYIHKVNNNNPEDFVAYGVKF